MQGEFLRMCLLNVRRWCAVLIILCCVCVHVRAQSPAFFRYTSSSGLSAEEIYDVKQDSKGYMWFATDRGAFRYDGYSFLPFTTAQGLTDNTVFRIHEDAQGRIWFLTFNCRLCYFDSGSIVEYAYNDTLDKYIPGTRILRSIQVSENGSVQLGFLVHGMVEIATDGKFIRIPPAYTATGFRDFIVSEDKGQLIMSTVAARSNKIVPGTSSLVVKSGGGETRFPLSIEPGRHYITGLRRHSGSLVVCIDKVLVEIDTADKLTVSALPHSALCIYEDSGHSLWIGFDGGGAWKYTVSGPLLTTPHEVFFPGEIITSITEDTEGAFWICTHHSGVLYIPDVRIRSWVMSGEDQAISLLPGNGNRMLVLWRDHGLSEISDTGMRVFNMQKAGCVFRSCAWNYRRDSVLMASTDGLFMVDPASGVAERLYGTGKFAANNATCTRNEMYVGMAWTLNRISPSGERIIVGSPGVRHRPDVLLTARDETVWMGGLNGLHKVRDSTMESYASVHEIFSRRIADMCELSDSTLVVATQSNGVALLKNGEVITLSQSNGFPCDYVYGVTQGENNTVWCLSKSGLFLLERSQDSVSFTRYPVLDEILTNGGKICYAPQSGLLWLCNGAQVIAFNPDEIRLPEIAPPVYIHEITNGDSILSPMDTAELNYAHNFIRIAYAGLAYRLHGKIYYRYRLNRDAAWQYTQQGAVQFAALEPGSYTFEVQAQNANGQWSASPAKYSFVITPPLWKTWWFIAGISVLLLIIGYAAFAYRFRSIRRQDLLRERALLFRQQALASQMNPHFVFNALNTIQSLVLRDKKTEALDMFSSFATLLRKSLEYSTEGYISLEEEIRMLNLYFELEEMRFEGKLTYSITVGDDIEPTELRIPAMLIQPLVENALLHGVRKRTEGGSVSVLFEMRNGQLYAVIDDNGIGRSQQPGNGRGNKPSGTNITSDRLRVLGEINRREYTFTITDKTDPFTGQPSGTVVTLALPCITEQSSQNEKAESIFSGR